MGQFLDTFLNWQYIWQVFPDLLKTGLVNTLILAGASAVIGTVLGMVLAVMGLSTKVWLRWPARVYTDIFRGLPAILTILVIGQGLGTLARPLVGTNPYPLGITALSLIAAAYIGEIFRAGIQSVDKGQMEASRALGMTYTKAMLLVVIPQGVRRVLPALVNQFIALVKDSTLVYFLGFITSQRELFRIGQDLAANTGNLSPLVAAGFVYLVITVPLTHLVNYIDKRLQTGRKVRAGDKGDGGDLQLVTSGSGMSL
ncbi:amino acid ABC transporter permease [Amycolatopsis sp. FDAARGOS 1241]|uniref:amino acid ABC transporter permease n=1 Tax=Amycolatopsis sp. FDAARGOS 1241 TaxID=2778070 RepID=UPI001951D445|nr:amino acid ABC transporter permease [Amycolatopsis sp. FDAARGOS 1241]QRP46319.1 amino acid ABC transporter permease [Amycolatopsis sp. FDAARGOS 1241]